MIDILLKAVACITYIYLAVSTLYLLLLAVAGRCMNRAKQLVNFPVVKKNILVLIPAYREDRIIVDTAEQACLHNYPLGHFQVVVIADQLQETTLLKLQQLPVTVINVHFEISMKSRSLHAGLMWGQDKAFDIAVILDADNVMEPDFLEKINATHHAGHRAIQCHRVAKNKGTSVSLLDAVSEEININIFRRGAANLGLSASPMGSGMAFDMALLQHIFNEERILSDPAEDREIDFQLMKMNIPMQFMDDALVFDEKVDNTASFEKQRIRWIEAQIGHFQRFFRPDMKNVQKTVVYYSKLYQTMLLPRLLFLVVFFLLALLLVIQWTASVVIIPFNPWWWLTCILLYGLVLVISVPPKYFTIRTLKAIVQVPILAVSMIRAVLQIKKNRKLFIHTEKTYTVK